MILLDTYLASNLLAFRDHVYDGSHALCKSHSDYDRRCWIPRPCSVLQGNIRWSTSYNRAVTLPFCSIISPARTYGRYVFLNLKTYSLWFAGDTSRYRAYHSVTNWWVQGIVKLGMTVTQHLTVGADRIIDEMIFKCTHTTVYTIRPFLIEWALLNGFIGDWLFLTWHQTYRKAFGDSSSGCRRVSWG